MNKRAFATATLLSFALAAPASADPMPWTGELSLSQAIQRAQTAGFDVRMVQADRDAAAAKGASARSQLLPSIGAQGTTLNGGIAQFGMPVAQQTYLSLTASLPLFVPSAAQSTKAAERGDAAAQFAVFAQRNDAMLSATQGYERALLAQAVVESRTVTVQFEQRHVDDVSARVKAGASPRYQLVESQAALAQAQQSLEDATADRDESIADLEVALDFTIDPQLRLGDALAPLTLPGDVTSFLNRAISQNPAVRVATAEYEATQGRLAAAKAAYLPSIAATGQTYNGHSNPNLGSHGYELGVSATLPIVDGGGRIAAVHEAQANVDRSEVALEQARLSVQRDVTNAWREFEAAQRDLASSRVRAVSAAEELRISALRERAGKGITLETLSALSDDASARENVLRAVARLNVAIASVHHAAGDAAL